MEHIKEIKQAIMIGEYKSSFNKEDYRSRIYSGDWTKQWLKHVSKRAILSKENIFNKMWEMSNEKVEHMPKSLFKFYSFNQNSLKCIELNKVYLNSPENFNDPYDCFICSDEEEFVKKLFIEYIKKNDFIQKGIITESEFEKIMFSYPIIEHNSISFSSTFAGVLNSIFLTDNIRGEKLYNLRHQASKEYEKTISYLKDNRVKVTSFSNFDEQKLCCSTEMWGHYAASHTGFCVEYDIESRLENTTLDSLIRGGMLPCRYSRKPIFIPSSLFWKYYNGNKMTENQQVQFDKYILLSFLNKSSSWKYENEWRLIVPNEISEIHDNLIDFFPIKTLYLGVKMPKSDKEYLYDFAKRKNISIVDMCYRSDAYEMSFLTVNVNDYIKYRNMFRKTDIIKSEYGYLWDLYN